MAFDSPYAPELIGLTKLRDLRLEGPSQVGRPSHVSAASGLVRIDRTLYVIADDELQLGIFSLDDDKPGQLLRLGARTLELDPVLRKRTKPDFEALVHIPTIDGSKHGGLLALGSGSTTQRVVATWIELDARGALTGNFVSFTLEHVYAALAREIGEVNIEGAVVRGEELLLLQRGNKGRGINALIGFDLRVVQLALHGEAPEAFEPSSIERFELGTVDGVPLGFSDVAALEDGRIVFSAIAEDTADPYADGRFAGAAIGVIDCDKRVAHMARVRERAKIEGIAARLRDSTAELLLVTDDDDPAVPASLYSAQLSVARY
jgi:hypothetical protein